VEHFKDLCSNSLMSIPTTVYIGVLMHQKNQCICSCFNRKKGGVILKGIWSNGNTEVNEKKSVGTIVVSVSNSLIIHDLIR